LYTLKWVILHIVLSAQKLHQIGKVFYGTQYGPTVLQLYYQFFC
jgi:hypothetical protein